MYEAITRIEVKFDPFDKKPLKSSDDRQIVYLY